MKRIRHVTALFMIVVSLSCPDYVIIVSVNKYIFGTILTLMLLVADLAHTK